MIKLDVIIFLIICYYLHYVEINVFNTTTFFQLKNTDTHLMMISMRRMQCCKKIMK